MASCEGTLHRLRQTTVWYDDLTGNDGCPTCAIEGQFAPHVRLVRRDAIAPRRDLSGARRVQGVISIGT